MSYLGQSQQEGNGSQLVPFSLLHISASLVFPCNALGAHSPILLISADLNSSSSSSILLFDKNYAWILKSLFNYRLEYFEKRTTIWCTIFVNYLYASVLLLIGNLSPGSKLKSNRRGGSCFSFSELPWHALS